MSSVRPGAARETGLLTKVPKSMNSKNEFHQAPIARVVATRGLHAGQGEDLGWVAVRERGGGTSRRPGRGQGSS